MALAWEMLELARLIYNNNGGPDTHANKLADCHLYIGDILAEQVCMVAAQLCRSQPAVLVHAYPAPVAAHPVLWCSLDGLFGGWRPNIQDCSLELKAVL